MKRLALRIAAACALAPVYALLNACSDRQSALAPQGPVANRIAMFFWIMLAVAGAILALVMALLMIGIFRGRRLVEGKPLSHSQSRNLVLAAGVAMPVAALLAFVAFSAATDQVAASVPPNALAIEIVGRR